MNATMKTDGAASPKPFRRGQPPLMLPARFHGWAAAAFAATGMGTWALEAIPDKGTAETAALLALLAILAALAGGVGILLLGTIPRKTKVSPASMDRAILRLCLTATAVALAANAIAKEDAQLAVTLLLVAATAHLVAYARERRAGSGIRRASWGIALAAAPSAAAALLFAPLAGNALDGLVLCMLCWLAICISLFASCEIEGEEAQPSDRPAPAAR